MHRLLLAAALLIAAANVHAFKSSSSPETSLAGRWTVNTALSDDGDAMLARRREEQMKRIEREEERRRRRMQNDPFAWEPEFSPPARTPQRIAAMEERERRTRQTLGLTKFLEIEQDERGSKVTITSEFETRRLDAGARSQVSLPQGQLADAEYGWDGDWFVIERTARGGPRVVEKYRRLEKTDQLEMIVTVRGDSALSGMKVRRIFDRAPAEARTQPREDVMGPVR